MSPVCTFYGTHRLWLKMQKSNFKIYYETANHALKTAHLVVRSDAWIIDG